jgi:hypothetical protein
MEGVKEIFASAPTHVESIQDSSKAYMEDENHVYEV